MSLKFLLIVAVLWTSVSTAPTPAPLVLEKGDIIRYHRDDREPVYDHYALYVGDEKFLGKTQDQDIFEMTGYSNFKGIASDCYFGKLDKGKNHEVFNYLDGEVDPLKWSVMVETIKKLHNTCGFWKPTKTCEHVATYIRYGAGHSMCQQRGTKMGSIFKKWPGLVRPHESLRSRRSRQGFAAAAAA